MKDVEVADSHLAAVQKHMGSKGDIAGIYGAVRQEAGLKFENWALKLKYWSQIFWDLSILDQTSSPARSTVFKLYEFASLRPIFETRGGGLWCIAIQSYEHSHMF